MRILAISNLYPPFFLGGYEIRCQQVVDELRARGHYIVVLTSTYRLDGRDALGETHVQRKIATYRFGDSSNRSIWRYGLGLWMDARRLAVLIRAEQPDLIYLWNMGGLPNTLISCVQHTELPVVVDVSDYWLRDLQDRWVAFWQHMPMSPIKRSVKALLKRGMSRLTSLEIPRLDYRYMYFTSHALKEAYLSLGFPVSHAPIIYCGIPVQRFAVERDRIRPPLKALYVGRVEQAKGVHTAIEAIGLLTQCNELPAISLTVVGEPLDSQYEVRLLDLVKRYQITEQVRFLGRLPYRAMPDMYRGHDVLLFPSLWDAFALTILEAMASGLVVVGTITGGSKEILEEGQNALTFAPGNAQALADQLHRLLSDPALSQRLATHGQQLVRQRFSLEAMVDQIEAMLVRAVSEHSPGVAIDRQEGLR
jgi:glycogen(starch) synthase